MTLGGVAVIVCTASITFPITSRRHSPDIPRGPPPGQLPLPTSTTTAAETPLLWPALFHPTFVLIGSTNSPILPLLSPG